MAGIAAQGGRLVAWLRRRGAELRLSLRMTAAGLITFALAELLHLSQGYWAVLTAVMVIQSSVGGSLKATLDRFIGTLGGAVYGAVVGSLIPHTDAVALGMVLAVALAPLAFLAAINASFRIAPVTAVIVLLGTTTRQTGLLEFATGRVSEIALGCAVGFAVSLLVLPARGHDLTARAARSALELLAELVGAIVAGLTAERDRADIARLNDRIRSALNALEASAEEAARERRIRLADEPDAEPLVHTVRRLRSDLVMVARAAAKPLPEPFRTRLAPALASLSDAVQRFLRDTGAALAARRHPPDLDAAAAALDGYAATMAELRRERLTRDLSDDEAGRIFALGFALEQLRRDLQDLASRAAEFARLPRRLLSGRADAV
jgi:uncharacterized membrane protein YccC